MRKPTKLLAVGLILLALTFVALLQLHHSKRPAVASDDSSAAPQAVAEDNGSSSGQTASLDSWVARYGQSANPSDAALLAEGIRLAQERRERMLHLLQTDPDQALQQAISYAEYAKLPPEMQALVERPFTEPVDIDVVAVCDHDESTPETRVALALADGSLARTAQAEFPRAAYSKRSAPLQGIELDGWAAVRSQVFQPLQSDEDRAWASEALPLANGAENQDFLTGEPIVGAPVVALAGGYRFLFASADNLDALENQIAPLDRLPGETSGSRSILAMVERKVNGAFPIEEFVQTQNVVAFANGFGLKTMLIIRVVFSDSVNGTPFEAAALETMVNNSVSDSLQAFSFNQTDVQATATTSVFTLPHDNAYYATDQKTDSMIDDAVGAYTGAGNSDPYASYDVVCVSFPKVDSFGWAGLASVGGANQWLNGNVTADTILHELGHNYGLKHANYWKFDAGDPSSTNPVEPAPNGANEEYGDYFDVMGKGETPEAHFHMGAKALLGWIPSNQSATLISANDNGTYRIYPFDTATASGLQALKVAKSASSDYYWIGKRSRFDGYENFERGAYLLWQQGQNPYNQSWLVDTTPGSADGRNDAGIPLGATYADVASNLYITPLQVGTDANGEYLDVDVEFGPFPGNHAPTGSMSGPSAGEARAPIAFSASASDADSDDLAYRWDFGDGVNENSAATVNHSFPVGGDYTVSVTISDRKGGSVTLQSSITVSDPINNLSDRDSGTNRALYALAANGSLVVATGSGGTILRSIDGDTWNKTTLSSSTNIHLRSVTWTGSEFVAAGADYDFNIASWLGVVYSSSDGTNWTRILRTTESVGDSGFVSSASSADGTTQVFATSNGKVYTRTNSDSWNIHDFGLTGPFYWQANVSVAYGDGYFVLGSRDSDAQKLVLKRSQNGIDWEDIEADSGILDWKGQSEIRYLNGFFLGSGFYSSINFSINNGTTWPTNYPIVDVEASHYQIDSFAFGNGMFAANGRYLDKDDTILAYVDFLSPNGQVWRKFSTAPDVAYNDRIFFNNTFISVGDAGLIRQTDPFNVPVPLTGFALWTSTYGLGEADTGALSNPDGDWAVNFIEYALGSDPNDPASAPRPPQLTFDGSGHAVISIARYVKTDVALTLEYSNDLQTWKDLAGSATTDSDSLLEYVSTDAFLDNLPFYVRFKAVE